MSEFKTDFTDKECKMFISFYNTEKKKEFTTMELADSIGEKQSNPYFYRILNYLIDNNIVTVNTRGKTRLFKIDKRKLEDLLDVQKIINYWHDIIDMLYTTIN